ncbi:calcium uniporter protein 4, mitochondrial [Gossypium hirsutum]|uniref:Calcium uniporter protein 4, mitochondrial n=1 Tax=Gossypium hirsutum TaxID=3635 RepID=A0ABM3BL97_GOSHI|nr:calcium uniporter protein 4, mitochondrial-like [Gossypium hirsutum]
MGLASETTMHENKHASDPKEAGLCGRFEGNLADTPVPVTGRIEYQNIIGFFDGLHLRPLEQPSPGFPKIFSVPVGEKLIEKLRGINISGNQLRLEGITQPRPLPMDARAKVSVEDARKLLRASQIQKLKAKLREIPKSSISYYEFVQICLDGCGNEAQGLELAKVLDHSGNVIVLGNVVFLRPEELAKSMESMISESMALPDDPRRKELEEMGKQKAEIDKKAKAQVRGELYCGLGFLLLQTLGFMRLTFWELSWDVMEPICFFVTSLHFASAYGFFLTTSTEPSFEGYFQRRFKTKQRKLIKAHSFDIEKYNKLRQALYPNISNVLPSLERCSSTTLKHEDEAFL